MTDRTTIAALPDFDLATTPGFAAVAGLIIDDATSTHVRGHLNLGPEHHTPWGIVNGGVYTTIVEGASCIGASTAASKHGQHAVAVHHATDLLRSCTEGTATVFAEPIHQGRSHQLWVVTILDEHSRQVARGQARLHNIPPLPLPAPTTGRSEVAAPGWSPHEQSEPVEVSATATGDEARMPDLSLKAASEFAAALGLEFDEVAADIVRGHIELGRQHHNPWGLIHGGVYSTVVERAASVGASQATADRDQFAVGVHNATDTFANQIEGPAEVLAEPVFRGEHQQVWSATILSSVDDQLLARGQLRVQNMPNRNSRH